MVRRVHRLVAGIVAAILALAGSLALAAPAAAAPQPAFGTTVEVTIQPSGDSLLGSTARVSRSGGGFAVTLGEAPGADVQVSLREGGTEFAVCVIPAVDTSCGAPIPGADPGSRSIDVHLTRDADAVVHSGTLFFVDDAAPSVRLEWRDAAGNWIESPGNAMPLHGGTAARCVVTNEGNAAFEFDSFSGFVGGAVSGGGPVTVPLEATVPAGATVPFEFWSGPVAGVTSSSCSGSIRYAPGILNGTGVGDGVVPVEGTFALSAATAEPGDLLRLTATSVTPPFGEYTVSLDGVVVASGVTVEMPAGSFEVGVPIPEDAAPGEHTVTLSMTWEDRPSVVFATFPVALPAPPSPPEPTLPAESTLPATGTEATPALWALALVLAGAGALTAARRARSAG